MNTFPPKPGTVAYRVLAHLETILPRRPRATVGMIAGELRGLTPSQVRDACEAAHAEGYLNRSHEVSATGRGPVFYELVRRTTGDFAVAETRAAAQPDPDFDEVRGSGAAVSPSGVIEPVVDPHPPVVDATPVPPSGPILAAHDPSAALSKVVAIRSRSDGGFEAEIERTPQLTDWLRAAHGLPVALAAEPDPRDVHLPAGGVLLEHRLEFDPGPIAGDPPPEAAPEVTVALDFAPGPDQFAVAISSDGRLHCWRGVVPYVFSRLEVRRLVEYLNRVDLDDLLADAP